jgi:phosphoribosylglycinamide formyltransferase-1
LKPKLRVAVFVSGSGSNLEALIRAERAGRLKAEIALVVCDNPDAFAIARANKYGKPVFLCEPKAFGSREDFEKAVVEVLKKDKIGLVALAGFMRILTPFFVNAFRGRILNVHPSLLPAFPGASAIRDAFQHGAKVTGVTVHFVTEELDGGPIILQRSIKIGPHETLDGLEAKVHSVEHRLYPEAVRLFAKDRLVLRNRKVTIER